LSSLLYAWNFTLHYFHEILVNILCTLSSRAPVLCWVTEVSVLHDHKSGTVYAALCESLRWTSDSSKRYQRHFCLSETAAH